MLGLPEETDEPNRKPSLVDDAYAALKEAIRENTFPLATKGRSRRLPRGSE